MVNRQQLLAQEEAAAETAHRAQLAEQRASQRLAAAQAAEAAVRKEQLQLLVRA